MKHAQYSEWVLIIDSTGHDFDDSGSGLILRHIHASSACVIGVGPQSLHDERLRYPNSFSDELDRVNCRGLRPVCCKSLFNLFAAAEHPAARATQLWVRAALRSPRRCHEATAPSWRCISADSDVVLKPMRCQQTQDWRLERCPATSSGPPPDGGAALLRNTAGRAMWRCCCWPRSLANTGVRRPWWEWRGQRAR